MTITISTDNNNHTSNNNNNNNRPNYYYKDYDKGRKVLPAKLLLQNVNSKRRNDGGNNDNNNSSNEGDDTGSNNNNSNGTTNASTDDGPVSNNTGHANSNNNSNNDNSFNVIPSIAVTPINMAYQLGIDFSDDLIALIRVTKLATITPDNKTDSKLVASLDNNGYGDSMQAFMDANAAELLRNCTIFNDGTNDIHVLPTHIQCLCLPRLFVNYIKFHGEIDHDQFTAFPANKTTNDEYIIFVNKIQMREITEADFVITNTHNDMATRLNNFDDHLAQHINITRIAVITSAKETTSKLVISLYKNGYGDNMDIFMQANMDDIISEIIC